MQIQLASSTSSVIFVMKSLTLFMEEDWIPSLTSVFEQISILGRQM